MNLAKKVKQKMADPLLTFKYFERFIAAFCISIPLLLWLVDAPDDHKFRGSVSNYVYMNKSYIFGLLLTMAAMLFIFNGAVYYNNEKHLNISWHGQWYNIVLGLSLIGVVCFPHKEYAIPHYIFAGIFFLGNALVTGIFYKDKDKKKSIFLAILTVAALPLALINVISLLVAEWISLGVIAVHFILSTIDINEPVNYNKPKS
jgi:hypothetical protein